MLQEQRQHKEWTDDHWTSGDSRDRLRARAGRPSLVPDVRRATCFHASGARHYLILLPAAHLGYVFLVQFIYCFAEVEKERPQP